MSQTQVSRILKLLTEIHRAMVGEWFTDQDRDLILEHVSEIRADVIVHSINPLPIEETP